MIFTKRRFVAAHWLTKACGSTQHYVWILKNGRRDVA